MRVGARRTVGLAFGIFRAAMFAEPAVTNVEEVVGLVHYRGVSGAGCQVSAGRVSSASQADTRHPTPGTHSYYRRPASGVGVRRTGTDIRRPLRKICTCT